MSKAIGNEVIKAVYLIPGGEPPYKFAVSWQGYKKILFGLSVKTDRYREFQSQIEAWEFYKKKVNEMEMQR